MVYVQSGNEFVVAVREADALGATLLLGDRDARQTLRRPSPRPTPTPHAHAARPRPTPTPHAHALARAKAKAQAWPQD